MRHPIVLFIVSFVGSCFAMQPAFAEKRIALVIGNSSYQNAPRLPNPSNDADAIADMFRVAKFDVVDLRFDLSIVEMRRALRDFTDKSRDADIAVIYYAGHGMEIEGTNYLIPVDAVLERDRDAYDEAISLDRVLQTIDTAKLLRLVILDACRENLFEVRMQRSAQKRSLSRGLASVEPSRSNSLVAFAAKAGSTADDGTDQHSPFTASLLKHLTSPGLDVRLALGEVRDDVMKATNDRQEPFVYGSLGGATVSLVSAQASKDTSPEPHVGQALNQSLYAALAVVRGQGHDFHALGVGQSQSAASEAALAQCSSKRCEVVQSYGPGQCVHLALGDRQIFWNRNLYGVGEGEFVLGSCNKIDQHCKIVTSGCLADR
jgi:uncharacterized caspase-like protein